MADQTQEIMDLAQKLGDLVAKHPATEKYRQAQKVVSEDAEASRLLADFDRQIETLGRQEQTGMPVTDATAPAIGEPSKPYCLPHQGEKPQPRAGRFHGHAPQDQPDLATPAGRDFAGGVGLRAACRRRDARIEIPGRSMALWLLKTEPGTYSYDDLVREEKATWDGVTNTTAQAHAHDEKGRQRPDLPHRRRARGGRRGRDRVQPISGSKGRRRQARHLRPQAEEEAAHPVTLDAIKADKSFAGWDLLRIGRLSVVPVPKDMWKRIEQLSSKS